MNRWGVRCEDIRTTVWYQNGVLTVRNWHRPVAVCARKVLVPCLLLLKGLRHVWERRWKVVGIFKLNNISNNGPRSSIDK